MQKRGYLIVSSFRTLILFLVTIYRGLFLRCICIL